MDVADACHALGIQTVAVTAGYIHAEPRREFYAKIDAANVDLKAFTDEFYHKICAAHLEPVKDTLRYLVRETKVWTEITTLIIPALNDSDAELDRSSPSSSRGELGPDVPLHFSAFHPDYKMTDIPPTPPRRCAAPARSRARPASATSTRATSTTATATRRAARRCGAAVIERDWYEILVDEPERTARAARAARRSRAGSATRSAPSAASACASSRFRDAFHLRHVAPETFRDVESGTLSHLRHVPASDMGKMRKRPQLTC